jgi:hypothetical protein
MDDDVKTLLAVLALIYGSANGVGLFKSSLDPVEKKTKELEAALNDPESATSFLRNKRKSLFGSLWTYGVIVYVLLVLIPIAFLGLVVRIGPDGALAAIGLSGDAGPASLLRGSLFYWILLGLSSVSAIQLLAVYLKGWRVGIKSFFKK